MNPKHPVYVISKGRWESRLTVKALLARNIPHRVVIEPQEFPQYSSVIDQKSLLTLPFSNLGQGSIPARNWVWEHAISEGHKWHWILDDNIRQFYLLRDNKNYRTGDGATFAAIEEFCERYENLPQAGMQYFMFVPRKVKHPPIIFNTRIYSCILLRNDLPFRWRGRYNEDTDLSLRILKAGFCTALFVAFEAEKMPTMTMKGGNTESLYSGDGRYQMAVSLMKQHPDVVRVGRRWNRWQHVVDYSPFKRNKLKLKPGVEIREGPNEFGMNPRKISACEGT